MPSLWTPQGMVQTEKDVLPLTRTELIALSHLHAIAQKFKWTLLCQKCGSVVTGQNTGHESAPAVSCKCREYRYAPSAG